MSETRWTIEWDPSHERVSLQIEGRLAAEAGQQAADRLREVAGLEQFTLVADLSELEGYDREARQAFQAAFIAMPGQMKGVLFVGLGPVYRMAAATVCLAARIKAEFFADAEALKEALRPPPTQPPPPHSQPGT